MDSKRKAKSILVAIILPLFFGSCDNSYDFKYYLSNQTEDTIMFKWFKEKDMCDSRWIASDSAKQQSLYDTVYVLPPNVKTEIMNYFVLGGGNADDASRNFENQMGCISCFGPILFKDGSSIQYSRNCAYHKNFYYAHSSFTKKEKRGSVSMSCIYYVTEEDHQQALLYGIR